MPLSAPDERICPRCRGMGWLVHDVSPGHALFGSRGLVPCDVCGQQRQAAYLLDLCGLTGEMLGYTFQTTKRLTANAAAYDAARQVVAYPQWFLTLQGAPGVGKTRLLGTIVNEARAAGRKAVYTTTAELLDHLRAAYAPGVAGALTFDALLDKVTDCTVLALDEFDRWNPTAWAQEKFFQLIEARYRDGERRLTCFATNAELDTLPQYITSRMQDRRCRVYTLSGPDIRRARG